MPTNRKLKEDITRLTYRIQELEERLCPCGQHDYIKVDTHWDDTPFGSDMICVYQCKRCGKKTKARV